MDDVLLVGSKVDSLSALKKYLRKPFTIKDLGPAKYFLGVEISRTEARAFLSQQKYVLDLLPDSGMSKTKLESILLPPGMNYLKFCEDRSSI